MDPSLRKSASLIADQCNGEQGCGTYNCFCPAKLNSAHCSDGQDVDVAIRKSKKPVDTDVDPNDKYAVKEMLDELVQSITNAMQMSSLGAGPKVYDVQFTVDKQVIYVMEKFDMDLDEYIVQLRETEDPNGKIGQALSRQTTEILRKMADNNMSCYDIKPPNAVVKLNATAGGIPILKFIDFDADFCVANKNFTMNSTHAKDAALKAQYVSAGRSLTDFAYETMLALFCLHLKKAGFNYLARAVKEQIDVDTQNAIASIAEDEDTYLNVVTVHYGFDPSSYRILNEDHFIPAVGKNDDDDVEMDVLPASDASTHVSSFRSSAAAPEGTGETVSAPRDISKSTLKFSPVKMDVSPERSIRRHSPMMSIGL